MSRLGTKKPSYLNRMLMRCPNSQQMAPSLLDGAASAGSGQQPVSFPPVSFPATVLNAKMTQTFADSWGIASTFYLNTMVSFESKFMGPSQKSHVDNF